MGESDRYLEYKHIKPRFSFFEKGNSLLALIVINICIYLLLFVLQVAFYFSDKTEAFFYQEVMQWFALPAGLTRFSERPWTILSFMFSERSDYVLTLLSNMLWLFAFGYIFQHTAGNKRLIPVYIYAGWGGALCFLLSGTLMQTPPESMLLGSSAAVMGVAAAVTLYSPQYRILTHLRNGIPLWIMTAVYFFIDLAPLSGHSAPYTIAHLGGALSGVLFVLFLKKGKDGSAWMNHLFVWTGDLFTPGKKTAPVRETVFYNTGARKPFEKSGKVTQQRIDEILDKINQRGYDSLSVDEKEILKKAADEDI